MKHSVARIAYTNAKPFFYNWPLNEFGLVSGFPRQLTQAAEDNDVIAGPLPIVDCWKLESSHETLESWGISSSEQCQSVLVLSKKPFSKLNGAQVGVTRESSTSVALFNVLMRDRYKCDVTITRGLNRDNDAWLMIGDQALQTWAKQPLAEWDYVTDLATEWWNWQRLPFVFARWVVKRECDIRAKLRLREIVLACYKKGIKSLDEIAIREGRQLNLSPMIVKKYLLQFNYELGPKEKESMNIFREMVTGFKPQTVGAF